jgi:phenylpropionate dioxygenase-like ring-hydroxylating dioxygenase large terminal subunit
VKENMDNLGGDKKFQTPLLKDAWYIACRSKDLRHKPLAVRIFDTPIVLFRAGEEATAFIDRCPHRNVPLSAGSVRGDQLQCRYHGWCFDKVGVCQKIPALGQLSKEHRVRHFPTTEQQGFVWVYCGEGKAVGQPFAFANYDDHQTLYSDELFAASLFSVAENILDVPHTAFLHGGLFRRAGDLEPVKVRVTRTQQSVSAQYLGEKRPRGLVARVLAPVGGDIQHTDRFILPAIAEVEYRLGDSHLLITNALVPVSNSCTRVFTVFQIRVPKVLRFALPLLQPFARKIAAQDARILKMQTATIRDFSGDQFTYTKADVLGMHILKLLKQAQHHESPEDLHEEVEILI